MALKLLQPGTQPLGQFDGFDGDSTTGYLAIKGGEVMQFAKVLVGSTDLSASDAPVDGYVDGEYRTVVKFAEGDVPGAPYMLADEGTFGYGTLFGSVVGGVVGQTGTVAYGTAPTTQLGPHTATGSGKVTCWDKPGLYAVSLDAVDDTLQPGNGFAPGDAVYFVKTTGKLCGSGAASASDVQVATFVSYETTGSLVTTPASLVTSAGPARLAYVVIHFNPSGFLAP